MVYCPTIINAPLQRDYSIRPDRFKVKRLVFTSEEVGVFIRSAEHYDLVKPSHKVVSRVSDSACDSVTYALVKLDCQSRKQRGTIRSRVIGLFFRFCFILR